MAPKRIFITPEAQIVDLAQRFQPSHLPLFFKWTAVWRADPYNGRGLLPRPRGELVARGDGLFWEITDPRSGRVRCFLAPDVVLRLRAALAERP